MRGEQRAVCAELEVEFDYVTYSFVLASLTIFAALAVVSIFVLDWFSGWLPHGNRISIDLWSVAECDSGVGCWSRPFEAAAVGTFRWFAALTLWLTAVASAVVFVQTGRYLVGRKPWTPLTWIGHALCLAAIASTLLTASEPPRQFAAALQYGGGRVNAQSMSVAPFLLVIACVLGMFAMHAVTNWARFVARPTSRIPHARVVR